MNYVDLWGLSASESRKENTPLNHNKTFEIAKGAFEIAGGIIVAVGSVAGAVYLEVQSGGLLTPAAGSTALTGISIGSALVADGIGRITNALFGNETPNIMPEVIGNIVTDPTSSDAFKDLNESKRFLFKYFFKKSVLLLFVLDCIFVFQ